MAARKTRRSRKIPVAIPAGPSWLLAPGEAVLTPEAAASGDFLEALVFHEESNSERKTLRRRSASLLLELARRDKLTDAQLAAAFEIARIAETIGQSLGPRSTSLEMRVDYYGSSRDVLVEKFHLVRLQAAYSRWRHGLPRLPAARCMILNMVLDRCSLRDIERVYRTDRRTAVERLAEHLDRWHGACKEAWREVDERTALAAQTRAGGGVLLL